MVARAPSAPVPATSWRADRSIGSGVLVGIGVASFIDETVFHQLLHWHHFYDRSTPTISLDDSAVAALAMVARRRRDRGAGRAGCRRDGLPVCSTPVRVCGRPAGRFGWQIAPGRGRNDVRGGTPDEPPRSRQGHGPDR
jgi:hypothetical protein